MKNISPLTYFSTENIQKAKTNLKVCWDHSWNLNKINILNIKNLLYQ